MAKKKITDLQLRSSITDDLNIPSDDGIQTYRVTAAQLQDFVIEDNIITGPKIDAGAVSMSKIAQDLLDFLVPVGTVLPFAGSVAPPGYLLITAGGATEVSRATYSRLFAAIGTTYGNGDGSTTFGLPNIKGIALRFAGSQTYGGVNYSATLGQKRNDAIQNITGTFGANSDFNNGAGPDPTGAFTRGAAQASGYLPEANPFAFVHTFNAANVVRTDTQTHGADFALNAIIKF